MTYGVCDAAERVHDARPRGDVTFLFSDIVDAAARYERDPHAMATISRTHAALVRTSIESNGGYVFKTIGDAFCAAFREPPEALDAVRAIARGSGGADATDGIPVRIALHCGVADARDGDYFGVSVNRVARLLAIAHEGQIVLSEIAAQRLREAVPSFEARDLGPHRLKDLTEPERVFQLVEPGVREDFPPLESLGRFDNNLPQQVTGLIGRSGEVTAVGEMLALKRAVTVAGAAGIGKTRVALQIGAELLDTFSDGVWFVDLTAHGSAASVVACIAAVFGLRERSGEAFEQTLLTFLSRKKLLLILDNCEHLVTETARVTVAILRAAAGVSLLATSRQPLGIENEGVYRLPSLLVPPPALQLSAQDALGYGAVALFVERALAATRTFALDDGNASKIGDIVRRLDGIALAIELAAARMRALSPAQLAGRLDERFRLLSSANRGTLPRQQTMRAAIAWSFDLLSQAEQSLFEQLTIFSGGWSREAAIAICTDCGDAAAIAQSLAALVDKSLVVYDASVPPRYRLLESIREYGYERLVAAAKAEGAARRHARYFEAFARRADAAFDATPDLIWFADVGLELDNVRAALEWTIARGQDPALGAALAAALRPFWAVKAPVEGHRWLQRAQASVDSGDAPELAASIAVGLAGTSAARTTDLLPGLERALEIYRRIDDERGLARALVFYGDVLAWLGNLADGERALEEALAIHRRREDHQLVAVDLCALAVLERIRGRRSRSRELFAAALELFDVAQSTRGRAAVLANLADAECAAGNVARAITLGRGAQRAYRLLEDRARVAQLDCSLAGYHLALEQYDEASAHARLAVPPLRDAGDAPYLVRALQHLGVAAAFAGDYPRAVEILAYAERRSRTLPSGTGAIDPDVQLPVASLLRENVAPSELARLLARGAALSEDIVVDAALR